MLYIQSMQTIFEFLLDSQCNICVCPACVDVSVLIQSKKVITAVTVILIQCNPEASDILNTIHATRFWIV